MSTGLIWSWNRKILTSVLNVASEGSDASGSASPADATALAVLRDGARLDGWGSAGVGRRGGHRGRRMADGSRGARSSGHGAGEGAVEVAELDVGVDDRCRAALGLDVLGCAGAGRAGTTSDTRSSGVGVGGVVGVEPEHLGGVVVPEGKSEHHAVLDGGTHLLEAAHGSEPVVVAEDRLLLLAEVLGDGVGGVDAGDTRHAVGDDCTVLDVEAADLSEVAAGGAVVGNELGDDGELLAGVDGHALAEEGLVAHTEGVEVATIGVTEAVVPVVTLAALSTRAASLDIDSAGMRGECSTHGVGLPDVHLVAASTVLAASCIGIGARGSPAKDVGLWK